MRNLLVHLDSSAPCQARLELAVALARRLEARLVGAFAQMAGSTTTGLTSAWPPESYVRARDAAKAAFEAAAGGLAARDFMDVNRGEEKDILAQIVDLARHFDVIVCGQPLADHNVAPEDMIERIVVDSGRPALVVPHAGHFVEIGHRPLFAWTDSREAARAFLDGIRLTAPGAQATVVSISKADDATIAYRKRSLDLALAHLAAHGVQGKAEQPIATDIGVMDALLNEAADVSADLLVIGAFGGQGYPRFSRGSGSRFMLKHMTVPTLFSH